MKVAPNLGSLNRLSQKSEEENKESVNSTSSVVSSTATEETKHETSSESGAIETVQLSFPAKEANENKNLDQNCQVTSSEE